MERKRTPASRAYSALLFALTVLFLTASVHAQEARGRITGRVLDPTKATLSGASVKVTDTARGATTSVTTSKDGLFEVPYLVPGTYEVVIEFAGFKKHVRDKVRLQMNETRDLAVQLEVGNLEETVTVSTERGTNTSDGNLGLTVDAKRLAELPLIHGDPYKIMGLAPGLTHTGSQRLDRPYEPTHIIGFAYDGTRSNRSDLLIDGAPSTATANANEVIATYVPPSDLVQEFRVQTATFDAQFGNTEGGVTSISIKSGTNRLHGTVYYFAEPDTLGANDFFGKSRGQARVKSSSTRPGITLNGPVRIPGLYNGRDKTFFTLGHERIKDVRPRWDLAANAWIPTEALRNGDFSAYADKVKIYDPNTRQQTTPGTYVGTQFPDNKIPANRISPVAKAILDYSYPTQTKNPGLVGNMQDSGRSEIADYNSTTVRLDQQISGKNRMFMRGSYYKRDSTYNDYLGNDLTTSNFQFISYQAVIDDVHMFNPTTVLNIRYGYNRFERNSGQVPKYSSNFDLTQLGFPAAYNGLISDATRRYPRTEFGNMIGVAHGSDFRPVTSQTVSAVLNKSLAAHSVKLGMEMRIYREDSRSTNNASSGRYVFNNTYTRPGTAAATDYEGLQAYAAFLLGLPSTTEILRPADYSEYSKTWGFFVHDDWRVNRKLTLNIGLRYEVETPLTERNNKSVSSFDFDYVQPIQGTVQAKYAALNDPALKALRPQMDAKGGLLFAGVDTGSGLYETPKNTFLPRFGFAYQLNPKTVIRGGAGLFAGFLGQRRGDVIQTAGFSQTTTLSPGSNAYGAPIPQNMADAFLKNPILEPVGNALGRQTGLGQNVTYFVQDPKVSKQLRFQLGFQRELPGGFVFEAAYVGNRGYDIEITRNLNALPAKYLNTDNSLTPAMIDNDKFLSAQVDNPFAGLLKGTSRDSAKVSRATLLRPYPVWGDTFNSTNNDGKTWYNSAQVNLQKRFSHGYTLGISYTYSHWTQATEYLDGADPNPTKMISDLDVPHRLSLSGILEFPFGKGRALFSNASGLADAIIGGWQIQGVYTFQSGFPIRFGTNAFYNGTDPVNGSDIKLDKPTTQKWFNTDVFTNLANASGTAATPINHLRTLPTRFSDVRRDTINNVDLSLLKFVKFRGDARLELRFELVNAFNSPYFLAPYTDPRSATFGTIPSANQDNYARRAQIGAKLVF